MISPRFIYRRRNKSLDGWNRSGESLMFLVFVLSLLTAV
jgi:hypothetical protein